MRLEVLLILILIIVGELIYYKDGDFLSPLKGNNASTASKLFFMTSLMIMMKKTLIKYTTTRRATNPKPD